MEITVDKTSGFALIYGVSRGSLDNRKAVGRNGFAFSQMGVRSSLVIWFTVGNKQGQMIHFGRAFHHLGPPLCSFKITWSAMNLSYPRSIYSYDSSGWQTHTYTHTQCRHKSESLHNRSRCKLTTNPSSNHAGRLLYLVFLHYFPVPETRLFTVECLCPKHCSQANDPENH